MQKIKELLKDKTMIFFFISTILLAGLIYILPVLGDDLLHGSFGIGLSFMEDINGRYLGNLFGINLSSSIVLRLTVKTSILIGISFLAYKISGSKKNTVLLLALAIVIFLPKEIFRQVILNSSGFGNYVVPTLGILTIIYFHFKKDLKENKLLLPFMFLLGIIDSLFVEHVTVYNLILSIYLFGRSLFKEKNKKWYYLAYLLGSSFGTWLMFSNPIYLSSFRGTDDYRSITGIKDIFSKFCVIVDGAYFSNIFIVLMTAITSLFLSFKTKGPKLLTVVLRVSSSLFLTYYVVHILNPSWNIALDHQNYFNTIVSLLMLLDLVVLVIAARIEKNYKYKLLFILAGYVLLLAPLLVVNPIGPRCYYISYVLLTVFLLMLLSIFDEKKWLCLDNLNYVTVPFIAVIFSLNYSIYGEVYRASEDRINNIRSSIASQEEVMFTPLPHLDYLHGAEICPLYNELVYRRYYKIDDSIKFVKEGCQ